MDCLKLPSILLEFLNSKSPIMASLSKMLDISAFASAGSIFQHTQKDDVTFLVLAILSGLFYNFYIKEKPNPYHHVWFERPQQLDANRKGPDTRDIAVKLEENVSLNFHSF